MLTFALARHSAAKVEGRMRRLTSSTLLFSLLSTIGLSGQTPAARPAVPLEPISAILDAFKTHEIVALGEGSHGNEQGHAFRLSLIRDPRFAVTVNDIVVESGNARYQDVMDRFVDGGEVSPAELRRVWEDTTVASAIWDRPIYEELYRTVRAVNAKLPRGRRLRVLLGDPPIDWSVVRGPDDVLAWQKQRDTYPAEVIRKEVLGKKRRALLIYGDGHLVRAHPGTIVNLVESAGASPVFTIMTAPPVDLTTIQPDVAFWPAPSLAMFRGTVMGIKELGSYFGPFAQRTDDQFDALLYLGPSSAVTTSALSPALCADTGYIEMRMRRFALASGQVGQSGANRLKQYCASVGARRPFQSRNRLSPGCSRAFCLRLHWRARP